VTTAPALMTVPLSVAVGEPLRVSVPPVWGAAGVIYRLNVSARPGAATLASTQNTQYDDVSLELPAEQTATLATLLTVSDGGRAFDATTPGGTSAVGWYAVVAVSGTDVSDPDNPAPLTVPQLAQEGPLTVLFAPTRPPLEYFRQIASTDSGGGSCGCGCGQTIQLDSTCTSCGNHTHEHDCDILTARARVLAHIQGEFTLGTPYEKYDVVWVTDPDTHTRRFFMKACDNAAPCPPCPEPIPCPDFDCADCPPPSPPPPAKGSAYPGDGFTDSPFINTADEVYAAGYRPENPDGDFWNASHGVVDGRTRWITVNGLDYTWDAPPGATHGLSHGHWWNGGGTSAAFAETMAIPVWTEDAVATVSATNGWHDVPAPTPRVPNPWRTDGISGMPESWPQTFLGNG
jgi:hypothetical protein